MSKQFVKIAEYRDDLVSYNAIRSLCQIAGTYWFSVSGTTALLCSTTTKQDVRIGQYVVLESETKKMSVLNSEDIQTRFVVTEHARSTYVDQTTTEKT